MGGEKFSTGTCVPAPEPLTLLMPFEDDTKDIKDERHLMDKGVTLV